LVARLEFENDQIKRLLGQTRLSGSMAALQYLVFGALAVIVV
jgi:hypothetical protein